MRGGVETHYGARELARYADAVGVEYETLKAYRTVARAWESGIRIPDLPSTVHQALAGQDDRAERIRRPERRTVAAARQLVQDRTAERRYREIAARPGAGDTPRPEHDDQAQPPYCPPAPSVTQAAPATETTAPAPAVASAEVSAEPAAVVTPWCPGR